MEYLQALFNGDSKKIIDALSILDEQLNDFSRTLHSHVNADIRFKAHKLSSELRICGFHSAAEVVDKIEVTCRQNGNLDELKVQVLQEVDTLKKSIAEIRERM